MCCVYGPHNSGAVTQQRTYRQNVEVLEYAGCIDITGIAAGADG